jgi:hypothetical protein
MSGFARKPARLTTPPFDHLQFCKRLGGEKMIGNVSPLALEVWKEKTMMSHLSYALARAWLQG